MSHLSENRAPTEPKPKPKARQAAEMLTENTTCPDCGKRNTLHALSHTPQMCCEATPQRIHTVHNYPPILSVYP